MIAIAHQGIEASRLPRGLRNRQRFLLIALLSTLGLVTVLAAAFGAVPVTYEGVLEAGSIDQVVFTDIRAPRVLLAAVVGMGLSISGAILQGLFRNPLADPGLIGVSSGAALGAISMIVLGSALNVPEILTPYLLPLASILGAAMVTAFLFVFAQRYGRFNIVTILLVGIAVNAIAGVGIGGFQYVSDDAQLRTLTFWMMGSFGRASWPTVVPVVTLICLGCLLLVREARALDLIQLGDSEARYLGIDTDRLKRRIILIAAIATGAGVAVAGMIGFVGLVVPHLVRLLGGATHHYVLPASALLGATLIAGADLLARTIMIPAELPVSLVTSAIGAPFFLWLITRVRVQ